MRETHRFLRGLAVLKTRAEWDAQVCLRAWSMLNGDTVQVDACITD
jgi:hypothetical protein